MSDKIDGLKATPAERLHEAIMYFVRFRGIGAEEELLSFFGEKRLGEIYDGDEPRFSELLEIANILGVPVGSFIFQDKGRVPELEVVWAEILYRAAHMSGEDCRDLALRIASVINEAAVQNGQVIDIASHIRTGGKP